MAIDETRFEEIQTAWANLRLVVNLEEAWDAVIQNYLALEKGLLNAAAEHMIVSMYDYHNFQDLRLAFAVKLSNLLSTCRAYLDHTPRHLNGLEPGQGETEAFRLATKREYDMRPGYQIMEALRNFSQHGGLPLHGATYDARRKEGNEAGMLQFSVATHLMVDRLRADKAFKRDVLKNVTEEKLAAEPLIRDYIEGLSCIHVDMRRLLQDRLQTWMKTIRDAIVDFRQSSSESSTIGLSAIHLGQGNVWLQTVPLIEDMLDRLTILQKRNRSLKSLTSSFVSSAPRPAQKKHS
jgi:hypothetical protein